MCFYEFSEPYGVILFPISPIWATFSIEIAKDKFQEYPIHLQARVEKVDAWDKNPPKRLLNHVPLLFQAILSLLNGSIYDFNIEIPVALDCVTSLVQKNEIELFCHWLINTEL